MTSSAKAVLCTNVLALISKHKPLANKETGVTRLVAAGVSRGTAQRLLSTDKDLRLETLDQLGEVLRVKPWQLLVPIEQKDALAALVGSMELSPKAESIAERFDAIRSEEAQKVAFALIDQVLQQAEYLDRANDGQPAKAAHVSESSQKPDSAQ